MSDTIFGMVEPFELVALLLVVFILYVALKIIGYMRKSERDWREVDKTKLRKWDEDDD